MANFPPVSSAPPPDDITTNLPFDTRIRSFPYGLQYRPAADMTAPSGNVLQHGYMVSALDSTNESPANPQPRYRLHFLYNPSQITVSHSAAAANTPLPSYNRPENIGVPIVGTGGNLSWSLLYDRTYEVNDPSHPAYDMGVLYDVAVLYGLVGITTPMNAQSGSDSSSTDPNDDSVNIDRDFGGGFDNTTNAATSDVLGVMQNFPIWATFGLQRNFGEQGRYTSAISVMKYFGYVNSLTVNYTHWTQSMIPDRCAIQIGMLLMANNGFSVPFS